jgi:hypothetical protein
MAFVAVAALVAVRPIEVVPTDVVPPVLPVLPVLPALAVAPLAHMPDWAGAGEVDRSQTAPQAATATSRRRGG